MYDCASADLAQIPEEPHAVASYINGDFANYDEALKRFPNARHLRISVTGMVVADAYDIEKGDYQPDDVPGLYSKARDAGVWRPCFYAQLDGVMPAVKKALNTVVKARSDVRLWVAYYNETPDLPAGYDAHQFTETALGRVLDESICASDFFQAAKPSPKPQPAEWTWKAQADITVNEKGEWTSEIHGVPSGS